MCVHVKVPFLSRMVGGLAAGRQKGVGDQTLPPQHRKTYNFYSLMHIFTLYILVIYLVDLSCTSSQEILAEAKKVTVMRPSLLSTDISDIILE